MIFFNGTWCVNFLCSLVGLGCSHYRDHWNKFDCLDTGLKYKWWSAVTSFCDNMHVVWYLLDWLVSRLNKWDLIFILLFSPSRTRLLGRVSGTLLKILVFKWNLWLWHIEKWEVAVECILRISVNVIFCLKSSRHVVTSNSCFVWTLARRMCTVIRLSCYRIMTARFGFREINVWFLLFYARLDWTYNGNVRSEQVGGGRIH